MRVFIARRTGLHSASHTSFCSSPSTTIGCTSSNCPQSTGHWNKLIKNRQALMTRKICVSVNEFSSSWPAGQLESGFFWEPDDRPLNTESLNFLHLLLFAVPSGDSQFLFFHPSPKRPSPYSRVCLSFCPGLVWRPRPDPFVPRGSHMAQAPCRWGTRLLGSEPAWLAFPFNTKEAT